MKRLIAFAVFAASLFGQGGATVAISKGNPDAAFTTLLYYTGTNLEYICRTPAFRAQPTFTWARSPSTTQGTLTSIAVLTNVGTVTTSANHGLTVGNRVTVAGATVDTDLNGTYYVQTVGSSTTFTITTASVADATYTESTLYVSTTAPRTTAAIWNIEKFSYDGSNNVIRDQYSVKAVSGGIATTNYAFVCDNRAVTTGTTKVTYQ